MLSLLAGAVIAAAGGANRYRRGALAAAHLASGGESFRIAAVKRAVGVFLYRPPGSGPGAKWRQQSRSVHLPSVC
jgi:hypothetical protein